MKYQSEVMKKLIVLIGCVSIMLSACQSNKYVFRKTYQSSNELIHNNVNKPNQHFLKVHMKNGDLYVFQKTWEIDENSNYINGFGQRFDYNRKPIDAGSFSIPIDSIAIFETNKKLDRTESGRVATLGILATLDVAFGVFCITTPKACFGSCPTFYTNPNVNFQDANAEGFSNAVVPALEYTDVDALRTHTSDSVFSLWMKNEALETHCVNSANLIAVPRIAGTTNLHGTNNNFYSCTETYQLTQASNSAGEMITSLLQKADLDEYRGETDSTDLSKKEEIILEFENMPANAQLGLQLTYRQSLLVTYLFYSMMGYMGDNISELFAELETNPDAMNRVNNGVKKLLGNIEVYSWNAEDENWIHQGYFYEEGPIARNLQVLPLSAKGEKIKLKLIVSKGFWRLDEVALTEIVSVQEPILIQPTAVLDKSEANTRQEQNLNDTTQYLISMPGDIWKIQYMMPNDGREYDLYLSSSGYYLEWMRSHWIKDKDLSKMYQMLYRPKQFLKSEAPTYKRYEDQMEEDFWNSRIDVNNFSYD
jgi:hypothetical protein